MRAPRLLRTAAAGLLLSAEVGVAQPLPPQPPGQSSPLERAERNRRIAEQQVTAQVRDAISLALKLARSHPEKAGRDLAQLRTAVNVNADLGSAKKDELHDQLTAAITTIQRGGPQPIVAVDPRVILRTQANRKAIDDAEAEAKDVRERVAAIARAEEDGRMAEARAGVADLYSKYPHNAAAIQLKEIGLVRHNIAEARALTEEMNRRVVASLNDVERSALPSVRDMEFPKNWKELSERRRRLNQVQLGAEEEALLLALEKPVTLAMKGQPFEEVIQTLSNSIGKNLYIDQRSMESLGVDMRKAVDLPAGVTVRTALRAMLQSVGMTFIIRDKIIKIVSVEEARKNTLTRAYEIRDLIQSGGPFNGGATWGPYLDFLQTQKNAENLVASIKESIDPNAWSDRGGPASILFHYPSMSVIVRGPSEVHYTLGQAMYGKKK